jgi:hypothetical protein
MEQTKAGWWSGLAGVVIFSGSLPATRVAVTDFSPLFLTSARAVIAALLAAGLLLLLRQRRPQRGDIIPLLSIAFNGNLRRPARRRATPASLLAIFPARCRDRGGLCDRLRNGRLIQR